MLRDPRLILLATLILLSSGSLSASADDKSLTYERDIRPIFRTYCFDCHGATKEKKGKLDLRLQRFLVRGGETGPAIVAGKAPDSLLIQRLRAGEMPPGDARVPEEQIVILERWISLGAPTARPEPETIPDGLGITSEERSYWAFQPITKPAEPPVKDAHRVRNPIDTFLLAQMQEKQLTFAPDADRLTLIKRVYLDLVGLPPSGEQIKNFIADTRPDAYERLVDEVLESKHYGERWGRHWLDVAGYADSEGYSNTDPVRNYAYKYRDYVIQSFNADLPFNQFIQEQLAGDEMVKPPFKNMSADNIRKLTATGFLRMAVDGTDSSNNDVSRNQMLADTIKIVSSSLLGVSVGCAQCHDHRYDPISHDDYHRIRAVFEPTFDWKKWRTPGNRKLSLYTDKDMAERTKVQQEAAVLEKERDTKQAEFIKIALEKEFDRYEEPLQATLRLAKATGGDKQTDEQKKLLKDHPNLNVNSGNLYQYNPKWRPLKEDYNKRIGKIKEKIPVEEFLRVATEVTGSIPKTFLFYRGDHRQPQHAVSPGGLTITSADSKPFAIADNQEDSPFSGRRLAYARWLTSGQHPLVARVLVNRFWLHHFGHGIVQTPDEFGKLGMLPTHPKLLDWMASYFMDHSWSLKQLHRLMMTSTAYRQSSVRNPKFDQIDTANDYYWHKSVQRLDAEIVRDRILAVSGKLDSTMFGTASGVKADDTGQIIVDGSNRRSVYIQVRRTQPVAVLQVFDAPVMTVNCGKRTMSTGANQSLMLMNSDFVLSYAKAFAERVSAEAKGKVKPELIAGLEIPFDPDWLASLNPWKFGYGFLATAAKEGTIPPVNFTPYPFFGGDTWKGGEKVPDEKLGYTFLNRTGGHPNTSKQRPIRRWIAPATGKLAIKGILKHSSDNGDGVQVTVYSSRLGKQGSWQVASGLVDYDLTLEVEKGDVIDTIVDERTNHTSDSFTNTYTISLVDKKTGKEKTWPSEKGFHGPIKTDGTKLTSPLVEQAAYAWELAYGRPPTRKEIELATNFIQTQLPLLMEQDTKQPVLQAMTNFCQALISSNEFLYSD